MKPPTDHLCRVSASPWPGVHGTHIDSARHYGRHWHETHGVGLLEAGAQTSASGRGIVDAYAGQVITTNPGEVHDGRPLGGASRRWRMLYFDPGVMASMTEASAPHHANIEFLRPVIEDAALTRALRRLFVRLDRWSAAGSTTGVDALACEELLIDACAVLLGRHADTVRHNDAEGDVKQVRDRLADDLLSPPTLAEMAAMAGLSKFQLLRRFQKSYGVPPHAWLLLQRAERARRLIRGGTGLADAAASCGFADQSHMTRIFVRQFGFTPGAWQRAKAPMHP